MLNVPQNKSSYILGVGRTSILDSSSGGDLSRDVISQPLSDIGVSILGNLWSGGLSSSNGPHWLIGENDLSPVGDAVLDSVKLSFEDIVGLLSFTFSQSLSNTEDCVKASLLRSENLLGNNGISLTEESSSLRVSNNCPLELKVLDLVSTDFTGESSILFCRDVLGRDLNIRIKHGLGRGNLKGDWSNDDLKSILVILHRVEHVGVVSDELDRPIALPVSSNDVFALSY